MLKHFTRLKSIAYNDVEKYVENVETVENSKNRACRGQAISEPSTLRIASSETAEILR